MEVLTKNKRTEPATEMNLEPRKNSNWLDPSSFPFWEGGDVQVLY